MSFLWCPFCRNPHLLSEEICPITGNPLKRQGKETVDVGSVIQGKYRLVRRLGQGAFGIVYAAQNVALGGEVAVKFLGQQSATAALRFDQEAKIANALGHPNICRVFDSGTTSSGTPFFVMELLRGQTLAERMEQSNLDPAEAIAIMSQVLSGLGAAHAKGIVHRDIKPENIFLEAREGLDPIAKILDFGLAKQEDLAITKASKGVAIGTILYMAPEQLQGDVPTAQCDVFATGVLMYQALSGRHPFFANSHMQVALRILNDTPEPLTVHVPQCPPSLAAAIEKAMEKNVADRFRTARELQSALHAAVGIRERAPSMKRMVGPSGLPRLNSSDSDSSVQRAATGLPRLTSDSEKLPASPSVHREPARRETHRLPRVRSSDHDKTPPKPSKRLPRVRSSDHEKTPEMPSHPLPRLTSSDGDDPETLITESKTVAELEAETQVGIAPPSDEETITHQVVGVGETD